MTCFSPAIQFTDNRYAFFNIHSITVLPFVWISFGGWHWHWHRRTMSMSCSEWSKKTSGKCCIFKKSEECSKIKLIKWILGSDWLPHGGRLLKGWNLKKKRRMLIPLNILVWCKLNSIRFQGIFMQKKTDLLLDFSTFLGLINFETIRGMYKLILGNNKFIFADIDKEEPLCFVETIIQFLLWLNPIVEYAGRGWNECGMW